MRYKRLIKIIKELFYGKTYPTPLKNLGFTIYLSPKERTISEPLDRNLVLRLNNSFLEITNGFFIKQGWALLGLLIFSLLALCTFAFGAGSLFREFFTDESGFHKYSLLWNIFSVVFMLCYTIFFGFFGLALLNATITLALVPGTHIPTRFCRKTQRVYSLTQTNSYFSKQNKLFNAAWKNTHFYLKRASYELWPKGSGQYEWDLIMVELNKDGDIVNEIHIDRVMGEEERDFYLLGQWEMIRRYMEEGPQSFPLPQVMLPIAHRRETFWEGWLVVYRSQTDPMYLAMAILGFLFPLPGLSRVLHKWIAKIPKWPDDVVIESAIDPNDPYRYEGGKNGTLIYVPPNTQFLLDLSLWAKFKIHIKNMLKKTLFREKYR